MMSPNAEVSTVHQQRTCHRMLRFSGHNILTCQKKNKPKQPIVSIYHMPKHKDA